MDMDISVLKGMTLSSVVNEGNDQVIFQAEDGRRFRMAHSQDCCESVGIEQIDGDLLDLVGSPIIMAEVAQSDNEDNGYWGMWTFYKLATSKGYVTIRWYGESNGYYSVDVSFSEEF